MRGRPALAGRRGWPSGEGVGLPRCHHRCELVVLVVVILVEMFFVSRRSTSVGGCGSSSHPPPSLVPLVRRLVWADYYTTTLQVDYYYIAR